jgi:GNAT superfamily N-acetyltransferase
LTDIDRITSLVERADARWTQQQLSAAADLLRRVIYLPNAAVLVAFDGRLMLGVAVLSLRPSIAAGGLVGAVDLLAVEPGHEVAGVTETLLRELIRSARNKGCVALEGGVPEDAGELARWESVGFSDAGSGLRTPIGRVPAAAR